MAKKSTSMKSKTATNKTRKPRIGGEKKAKSPGHRQPSAYLMFCAEQRSRRKSEFEKMAPKDIMKNLGAEWRGLSAQQKESYKSKVPHATPSKAESMVSKSQSHKRTSVGHSDVGGGSKSEQSGKHQSSSKKKAE